MSDPDVVVVGSGPNGLAAAVTLAAARLKVLVIEGQDTPGGGCRTTELTLGGYQHDVCASVHPLAVQSSFFRQFDLAAHGVRLLQPQVVFAHPLDGGRAGIARRSVTDTATGLGVDGPRYRRVMGPLVKDGEGVAGWILSAERRPPPQPLAMLRFGLLGGGPMSLLGRLFRTDEARGLLAGVAAHSMRPLSSPPTAGVGLLLTVLGHHTGWPVVEGGSGRLVGALVAHLERLGGTVELGRWIESLQELPPARAVLLDLSPRQLLRLAGDRLPAGYRRALRRYRYGPGICKVDFALAGPVPWTNPECRLAPTLHLGGTLEEIATGEREVARGHHPQAPYVLAVQASVVDRSRAPGDGQTLWAYCHVPPGSDFDMTDRIEAQIERFAPGFRDLILARVSRTARAQEAYDPTCVGGDIGCGAQTVWQTFARPVLRWDPYCTPLSDTYLCSAATIPGPGVHGLCGQLAALSCLRHTFGVSEPPSLN